MRSSTPERRYVSERIWFDANGATLEVVTAAVLLASVASMVLATSGMEELIVPLLVIALGILVLGIALSRLFYHLEMEGLPVVEHTRE